MQGFEWAYPCFGENTALKIKQEVEEGPAQRELLETIPLPELCLLAQSVPLFPWAWAGVLSGNTNASSSAAFHTTLRVFLIALCPLWCGGHLNAGALPNNVTINYSLSHICCSARTSFNIIGFPLKAILL